jgi:hypothetical protein
MVATCYHEETDLLSTERERERERINLMNGSFSLLNQLK